ncbi:MAG: alpha-L-fucosidase [Oscillospiraceae bacterium]|jgi:alpha-L-fucosidase|nr:alpha-L-fucosidase [Oscillospiraceae bacterium]
MPKYETRKTPGDTVWFTHDRFGMFIHWGLYALPARHEWVQHNESIQPEDYRKYFDRFDPDMYDPREWAKAAKAAGMKYAVMTAKHHEGFCMFDSAYTDYKCSNTNGAAKGRDLLKEYAAAFRAEGLRVGFYYSLIDWHHPDFVIDTLHPMRKRKDIHELNLSRDQKKYAQYMRDQVTELLTDYGQVDILWFDFSYPGHDERSDLNGKGKDDWEAEELIATARALQPNIIIDNRTQIEQDLWTPEQFQPDEWQKDSDGNLVVWEACQTFSGSWGYHRDEKSWKTPEILIRMLINTVACGGNLLLNVGPTARGYLDYRARDSLAAMGEWMKYNARSIYGCTQSAYAAPDNCRLTESEDGTRLYIHIYAYPFSNLHIPAALADKIEYAQFLHDSSEILIDRPKSAHGMNDGKVKFRLPSIKPAVIVPVIEVFLKQEA